MDKQLAEANCESMPHMSLEEGVCSACGISATWSVVHNTYGGDYRICAECLSEFQVHTDKSQIFKKFESEQARYYGDEDRVDSPLLSGVLERRAKQRVSVIQRYVTAGRVLEVGPGGGDVARLLKEVGFEVEAVEHSEMLSARLGHIFGDKIYRGAFEELDLGDSRFDAWMSFHVIEHVTNPERHLRAGWKVTRAGGWAFVATPNSRGWEHRVSGDLSPNYSTAHLRLYSPQGLSSLMQKAGWSIQGVFALPTEDGWIRVATSYLRHFRRRKINSATSRGKVSKTMPIWVGESALAVCRLILWMPAKFQRMFNGGNELLIVARKNA